MLKKTITWPGQRQDITAVLAESDIFVLPSTYREGIPRVLLEAAAMGLPIITTDAPGCREVVTHSLNGYLIPAHNKNALRDSILHLCDQPNLRRKFGKNSRKLAIEHFDLTKVAEQTRSVYLQLLREKGLFNSNGQAV